MEVSSMGSSNLLLLHDTQQDLANNHITSIEWGDACIKHGKSAMCVGR